MSGEEHYLDGGIYDAQGETRTDCYLKEHPGATAVDLHLVTGNADICVVEITPADLRRFARFLKDVATEVEAKALYLRDHKV